MTDEKSTDSVQHHKDRSTRMKEEYARAQKVRAENEEKERLKREQQQVAVQQANEEFLLQHAGPISPGETRDNLLERIRKMREDAKPKEPVYPPLSEAQQAQLDAEQAAGRAAVAAAEAAQAANRERMRQQEEEARKHEHTMNSVYRPNEPEPKAFPDMKGLKR